MEALRFNPKSKCLSVEKVPIPKIETDDEVIVEVAYAGVCGTDIHITKVCPEGDNSELFFLNTYRYHVYGILNIFKPNSLFYLENWPSSWIL